MKLLVDNDVIHKLAAFDLLPAAIDCLCGPDRQTLISPRTRFSMCVRKNQEKGQRKFGTEVHARIVAFVEKATSLNAASAPKDFGVLASVLGIDEGEAMLFANAAHDSAALVATGDLRSIDALVGATECSHIVQLLSGRILMVEHFVLAAIRRLGFEAVKQRVLPGVSVDTGIHAWAFGSGQGADEATAVAGLRRRIQKMQDQAHGLIHPQPV